jgi:hypothetical protein
VEKTGGVIVLLQLIKKELQLQGHNVLFALSLVGIWIVLWYVSTIAYDMRTLFQIIHYCIIIPGLLYFIPTLMGTECIATERKLQTLEREFSFPIAKDTQCGIKVLVSVCMALLVCCSFTTILDESMRAFQEAYNTNFLQLGTYWHWHQFCILLFVAIGFYSSSLCNDSLTAFFHSVVFFSLTVLLSYVTMGVVVVLFNLVFTVKDIPVDLNYSLLSLHHSQRNLPLNQSVDPLYLMLFYLRIILCSVVLFGFGYSNMYLEGMQKTRYTIHALVWITVIVTLTLLAI